MIGAGGCGALFHGLQGDVLCGRLHLEHTGDDVFESLVCDWRAPTIQFENPLTRYEEVLTKKSVTLLCILILTWVIRVERTGSLQDAQLALMSIAVLPLQFFTR